ncbi:multifunctional methyltransferase subunit TRM112-like protein [Littorina saxatilis]|uniref:Multifunctional methyltransferase subunit TRM112-like protein n=1 Tax=Littorina saxatilis TaxID=31220 RepID=A0AAN9AYU3_9CAEN
MKLLTHNMLTSNIIKGVTKGFPLVINPSRVEVQEVDFNPDFITRVLPKLDFTALKQAATQVGHADKLPEALPETADFGEDLQKTLHHVLLQVEVLEGELVCPETGRKFPISNGIPNMLLNEDEVS